MNIENYLEELGFKNKQTYWKRDDVYIQYDEVVMRITTGSKFQDYPIQLIKAFPDHMESRITSLKDIK